MCQSLYEEIEEVGLPKPQGPRRMTPLEQAISSLQDEVEGFHQGTKSQPKDDSADFFLLRAKALGLSALKRMIQLGVEGDPAATERFYRECAKQHKRTDVPEAIVVEREVAPT